ncbi:hypothetical protein VPH35_042412 [Triticum aestivum]
MIQEESSHSKITGKQLRRPTDKGFLELGLVPHIHGQICGCSDQNPQTPIPGAFSVSADEKTDQNLKRQGKQREKTELPGRSRGCVQGEGGIDELPHKFFIF